MTRRCVGRQVRRPVAGLTLSCGDGRRFTSGGATRGRGRSERVLPLAQGGEQRHLVGQRCACVRFADRADRRIRRAQERIGLRSSAIVDGSVGRPAIALRLLARGPLAIAALPGSTAAAKRRFASVYSWPQYTRVAAGSAASYDSDVHICAGVPSNRRPHPAANSVSPQKSTGAARVAADERDVAGRVARDVEHVEREPMPGRRCGRLRRRACVRPGIVSRAGPITGTARASRARRCRRHGPVMVRDDDRGQRERARARARRAPARRRRGRRRRQAAFADRPTRSCR